MTSREAGTSLAPESFEFFEQAVSGGVANALKSIRFRFDTAPNQFDRLPYHCVEHTEGVVRRTEMVLQTIQKADPALVSNRDILLGKLAGAFHDTVQISKPSEDGRTRKRETGMNETRSADEAIAYMRSVNVSARHEVFSADDMAKVQEAIMGTVPAFVDGTVVQPNVTPASSPVARAVALADICGAGMEPHKVVEEGKRIFREMNIGVQNLLSSGALSSKEQDAIRSQFLQAADGEVRFNTEREKKFRGEIAGFPVPVQEALKQLFSGFPEAIANLHTHRATLQGMSFKEMKVEMGYV